MDWTGKEVVITGAGGFIGSHLTERLIGLGAHIRAMTHGDRPDNLAHLQDAPPDNLKIVGGDLLDAPFIHQTIEGADTVFHLAAVTSVAYSYEHPEETIATNGIGTLNVCAAARAHNVRRLVHTSTAGVYGNTQDDQPITEAHPVTACNPYTAGKLAGDYAAQTYHLSYDLPVTTIRLFNTYGPRMGQYLIMPTIIQQLLQGPDLKLGDLRPTRPFVYIDEIVDAFLAMAEAEGVIGDLIHFGGQDDTSMQQLVQRIAALMDCPCNILRDETRIRPEKSEIFRVCVNTQKAKNRLGWQPKIALNEGLQATIDWMARTQNRSTP